MKLYQLTEKYTNLRDQLFAFDTEREEGDAHAEVDAVEQALANITDALEDKVESLALLALELDREAEGVKAEADRLANRKRALENRRDRLKDYIFENLQAADVMKVRGLRVTVALQKNQPAVIVEDGAEERLPMEYRRPVKVEADKKKLLVALQAGTKVPGCSVVQGLHLRIR